MVHPNEWSADEFETLLTNPQLSDERVSAILPGRSVGAISAVRGGIHRFHGGEPNRGLLSAMMLSRLEASSGSVTCAKCGQEF